MLPDRWHLLLLSLLASDHYASATTCESLASLQLPDGAITSAQTVAAGGKEWDWRTFDFDKGVALAEKVDNNTITANDPNLKPFFSHGGKLLMYHGWTDPLIAPENSINYYTSVLDKMGGASKAGIPSGYSWFPAWIIAAAAKGPNAFDSVSVMRTVGGKR